MTLHVIVERRVGLFRRWKHAADYPHETLFKLSMEHQSMSEARFRDDWLVWANAAPGRRVRFECKP